MAKVTKGQSKIRQIAKEIGTRKSSILKAFTKIGLGLAKTKEKTLQKWVHQEKGKIKKEFIVLLC